MTGWKSKTGAIAGAVGAALLAAVQVCPDPVLAEWLKFIGILLSGGGASLLGVGVAHKIEKTKQA